MEGITKWTVVKRVKHHPGYPHLGYTMNSPWPWSSVIASVSIYIVISAVPNKSGTGNRVLGSIGVSLGQEGSLVTLRDSDDVLCFCHQGRSHTGLQDCVCVGYRVYSTEERQEANKAPMYLLVSSGWHFLLFPTSQTGGPSRGSRQSQSLGPYLEKQWQILLLFRNIILQCEPARCVTKLTTDMERNGNKIKELLISLCGGHPSWWFGINLS